ncbi:hypothetical protein Tco_0267463 [Tanacetum coccineum]
MIITPKSCLYYITTGNSLGDENQPRILGDNVVPLRSDTIQLDLALYDNESWNDQRDFPKLVKVISLHQGVPSTSDRRLVELENQVQRLMEAHLAPKPSAQVNKIASSCEICGGPHNTQCCMENPKQVFVDYASSRTDEAREALPSDTVKSPKLNVNRSSSVSSTHSYSMEDPQSSSNPFHSVNPIKTCFKSTNTFQKDQPQIKTLTVNEIETPKLKELEKALEDEFKDLYLNLPVLEVLAHAPMYKSILDKYVESLELGKNRSAFIQSEMPKKMKDPRLFILPCRLGNSKPFDILADLVLEVQAHSPMYNSMLDKYVKSLELGKNRSAFIQSEMPKKMKDPRLFILPCRLGNSKPFDILADLGSCVNLIPLYLFKTLKIRLLEEIDTILGLAVELRHVP